MRLTLADVTVAFGTRVVLDDVSLSLRDGEATALVGPSGSGKTTLLSVMAGLRAPDQGRVEAPGPSDPGRRGADIAWVFQTSPALMRRSALENVRLGALVSGRNLKLSEKVARDALDLLGIGTLADGRLHRLSGGERQRVVIARALASQASLVLADEPTASLDQDAKALVCDALTAVADAGSCVVIATHDAYVADRCHRIVRLSSGRLEAADKGMPRALS